MNFKQFLKEEAIASSQFKTKKEIENWIYSINPNAGAIKYESDGAISLIDFTIDTLVIEKTSLINVNGYYALPVKFNFLNSDLQIKVPDGNFDLTGLPNLINGNLTIESKKIKNIGSLPFRADDMYLQASGIDSISNISERVISCLMIILPGNFENGLLDVLKIKQFGILRVEKPKNEKLKEAVKIINKYLKSNKPNIWQCQDELQDADLDEYADL